MHPFTSQFYQTWLLSAVFFAVIPIALSAVVHADHANSAGRYIDQSVLVHDTSQLDPLKQVANLQFNSRITVGEALRTALVGTGYRLLDPDAHPHSESHTLLVSRLAIPHQDFFEIRIDSALSAVIGAGRGFTLEVDHVARQIRVVPIFPIESQSARPPYRRYLQAAYEQGLDR